MSLTHGQASGTEVRGAFGVRKLAAAFQPPNFRGPWSVVRGPWSVVRGPWSQVPGPGPRSRSQVQVPGPWSVVRGLLSAFPHVRRRFLSLPMRSVSLPFPAVNLLLCGMHDSDTQNLRRTRRLQTHSHPLEPEVSVQHPKPPRHRTRVQPLNQPENENR
jgi:hypothetical protein